MSVQSEHVFTRKEFEARILGPFFPPECPWAELGRSLLEFGWSLDGRCHTQDWHGRVDRLAVFSLPFHLRAEEVPKNYLGIYRWGAEDPGVRVEALLASRVQDQEIARYDPGGRFLRNEKGHPWAFMKERGEFDYMVPLILAARSAKLMTERRGGPRRGWDEGEFHE
ncbi:MAG: hypothetical protein QF819_05470 [Gemmatimonadota bacterium]|jgi:hypothetical protein|nr:hypothetical protein [Gemmatimonadota bacterium]MDP6460423.1 hypothetical protein [Gemmatimonadota bacterium]MDP6529461.1 hypothetical protein [Gemmatimonadota bacterium]MDP6802611.1 hypothetical protein [Gemmatimonadota bacterium]MDP7030736.1 hypothetical protein [Gemmatimonadota bacterium]